ncbi:MULTISPECIES: cellulose binding domain-containing protein [Micromonospora]|uniref:cellulose binding domain-containing protein n=1 Tax=Micromonospora TaxID=1873 RepID=UPI001EE90F26|nr:cellulose binding domain-containing protein [Micromonospora hortensis]MCG5449355.1 cellulose-binding domain-containing protein [Micromonospora hortensis]WTI05832.1 cellulose-binding domain-containing protein [Micromonospora sp. NBC_00821]
MPATPPQPRRTVAIILLDRVVALVRATRRVLTGREDVSRATWVAVVAALGVLIATAVSIVGVLRTPEKMTPVTLDPPPSVEQVGASPSATPRAQARPALTSPAVTAAPSASASSVPPAVTSSTRPTPTGATAEPTPEALGAAFAITDNALLSYGATVTISNPGAVPAPGWTLVVTLPRESLGVSGVEGAQVSRDGAVWTFVPDPNTGQVPGNASVPVTFRVNGSLTGSAPKACTIDGVACSGLSN